MPKLRAHYEQGEVLINGNFSQKSGFKKSKRGEKKDKPKLDFRFLSDNIYTTAKPIEMKNMSK